MYLINIVTMYCIKFQVFIKYLNLFDLHAKRKYNAFHKLNEFTDAFNSWIRKSGR